jgi:hypothetical protein
MFLSRVTEYSFILHMCLTCLLGIALPSHFRGLPTCCLVETMAFHPKPISKAWNPSYLVWLLQAITHDLPAMCHPGTLYQIAKQSATFSNKLQIWLFHNQSIALIIKFNMNLQFCLLQKLVFLSMRLSSYCLAPVSDTTMPVMALCPLPYGSIPLQHVLLTYFHISQTVSNI